MKRYKGIFEFYFDAKHNQEAQKLVREMMEKFCSIELPVDIDMEVYDAEPSLFQRR